MDVLLLFALVILVPFLGALTTFFTGFGLNTILVPVFMIYWDAPLAVLMAGIVHLCNNILKVALTARSIDWNLFRNFGIPALIFAFFGANILNNLTFTSGSQIKPVFGIILVIFALLELFNWKLPLRGPWALRIGGSLSGFFGGFSGHQGALRALFLSQLKLNPLVFVATTAIISLLVDLTRIGVYFSSSWFVHYDSSYFIFLGVPSALIGTLIGKRYIQKIDHKYLSVVVGVALLLLGILLFFGLI